LAALRRDTPQKPPQEGQDMIGLVVNPAAGHGRALAAARRAKARFAERGAEVRELVGGSAEESRQLAGQAVDDGVDALVVVGGDGMVHVVLPALLGSEVPLGVIPAGTGNDQARAYGWPRRSAERAADLVLDGRRRAVDVGQVVTADDRTSYFGSVLAAGFDSLVSDRTNRMRWPHGRARYNLAMLAEFAYLRRLPFVLTFADGTVIERDLLLAAVGNTQSYGGGMRIAPDADSSDGLLDVTVVAAAQRRTVLARLPSVYRGTHVRHAEVEVRRTTGVRLESPGINAYADGEYLGPLPAEVSVLPAALQIITS
jgi:lipid kinase, YegS/Rv2252/BmrU family